MSTLPEGFSYTSLPLWILTILGFLMAFFITYIAIPLIVNAAEIKNLYAATNSRTSHLKHIPLLGGVAIFAGFTISLTSVVGIYFDQRLICFISALIIVFFTGVKDDITVSHPKIKLLGQTIATLYVTLFADIRISNMHEFLNIGDIPYLISIVFTILVLLAIINGFNLIDGIDGLASGIGILISSILGVWFYLTYNITFSVMSFTLSGTLLAFFYFNVFSKKYKIFLGDTGSLVIGLILGVIAVRFLQLEPDVQGIAVIKSTPAVTVSLFIVPLFDTLRVFTIRIAQGRSPFKADRQHIHHYLLMLGLNHLQSTIFLLLINLTFIIICYFLRDLGNIFLLGILLGLSVLLSQTLVVIAKKKNRKK